MRTAISIYLMIATACGPGLCCCAPGRAVAVLLRLAPAELAGCSPASVPVCCHGIKPAVSSEGANQQVSGEERPGGRVPVVPHKPCPCRESGGWAERLAPSPETRWAEQVEYLYSLVSVPSAAYLLAPTVSSPAYPIGTRGWATSEQPRAPHVLRC